MKSSIISGLCLAVVGAGVVTLTTPGQAAPPKQDAVAELRADAQGAVTMSKNSATGSVNFVRSARGGDLMPDKKATTTQQAAAKVDAFMAQHAQALGARPTDLKQVGASETTTGWMVKYNQVYRGVPVFGGELRAHLDEQGDLTAVNGFAAPSLNLDVTPSFATSRVEDLAKSFVRKDPRGSAEANKKADVSSLTADSSLSIYQIGAIKGEPGETRLAHLVTVKNDRGINENLVIDAKNLQLLNRWSLENHAMDRVLHSYTGTTPNKLWSEGDAFPGALNQDQQNLLNSTEEVYNMFKNAFGRDSFDNKGHQMDVRHNRPDNCPNASWNGLYTSYCKGVYGDDVVAHEWGHAYTEHTSSLVYQWQSGALNESMSDVWGETIDLLNKRQDDTEGDVTTPRTSDVCGPGTPARLSLTITAPAAQAGKCSLVLPMFGATNFPKGDIEVVAGKDPVDLPGTSPTDGCEPFFNSKDMRGKWVYVDESYCSPQDVSENAIRSGAIGILQGSKHPGMPAAEPLVFSDLPYAMVSKADGIRFKAAGTAKATIADGVTERVTSNRWMIGETSPALGAIRDMWNPTCFGNPGKVTDAEYTCDPKMADGGGVHYNSGVPNHLYALVTDGGTYEGRNITGLGIDRAAALWWKASSEYLTSTSDFADMSDSLESSCQALMGKPIKKLSLVKDGDAGMAPALTADDCASLSRAIDATEMRNNGIALCEQTPLFTPGKPTAKCGAGTVEKVVWSEDFENGLTGWSQSNEIAYAGGIHEEWTTRTTAQHPSKHAFGNASGTIGQCTGGPGDFSSVDMMASPAFTIPSGTVAPQLAFDLNIETESTVDGGQVFIKVNDGEFREIAFDSYTFNPPNGVFMAAPNNTNPRASQPAYTGAGNGSAKTAWGSSMVDLAAEGVHAGDTVQLRFDVSRDGCGGNDGFSLDNIKVSACAKASTPPPAVVKKPSVTKASVNPAKPKFKKAFTVQAKVMSAGKAATGTVTVRIDGKKVKVLTLKGGKASMRVVKVKGKFLKKGKHTVAIFYSGSKTAKASSVKKKFTVRR